MCGAALFFHDLGLLVLWSLYPLKIIPVYLGNDPAWAPVPGQGTLSQPVAPTGYGGYHLWHAGGHAFGSLAWLCPHVGD